MRTRFLNAQSPGAAAVIAEAAEALARGEPVALPTETVYGLAADALRPEAVVKIFEAKERPFFDPLIVHLPDRAWLEKLAAIPEKSRALVEALIASFWPGPLTLVLPRRALVPDLVTAGLQTVAVRMSAHPVFRAVIARFEKPLAAPSANRFGRISPTTATHVLAELGGRIPLIIDGGATEHGLESTIVRIAGERWQIARAGPVTAEMLAEHGLSACAADGLPARLSAEQAGSPLAAQDGSLCSGSAPLAPGQFKSHYAPRTPLLLQEEWDGWFKPNPLRSLETGVRRGLLAWRAGAPDRFYERVEILSPTGNLREAAATLFAKMRRLDDAGLDCIFAEPVPEHGLGIAIMDRLRKAAAAHA